MPYEFPIPDLPYAVQLGTVPFPNILGLEYGSPNNYDIMFCYATLRSQASNGALTLYMYRDENSWICKQYKLDEVDHNEPYLI